MAPALIECLPANSMIESTRSSPGCSLRTHNLERLDERVGGSFAVVAPMSVRQQMIATVANKTRHPAMFVFERMVIVRSVSYLLWGKRRSGAPAQRRLD